MTKKLLTGLLLTLGLMSAANAKIYTLAPKTTQCYLLSHDKLQQKLACHMTATAATGSVWWTRRDFRLENGKIIKTLAKDSQRKYLAKTDKVIMPYTSEMNPSEEVISITTINNRPAIRQNRWLKNYQIMSWEEFWGDHTELLPSQINQMTDRLACLQVEDKSFEICTPYPDNDFRTD